MFNLVTPVYSLVQSSILVIFCHGENRNDGHWSPNTHSIIQLEKISNNFVCLFVRGCWLWAMEVNVLPFPILSLPNPSFFSLPCLWYSIPEKNRKNKHYSISIYFCFLLTMLCSNHKAFNQGYFNFLELAKMMGKFFGCLSFKSTPILHTHFSYKNQHYCTTFISILPFTFKTNLSMYCVSFT